MFLVCSVFLFFVVVERIRYSDDDDTPTLIRYLTHNNSFKYSRVA